ncbi:MAG TPA: hypothetical protein VMU14_08255, partial [Acidimicrobiales bacterium]|nr:hypothetical protein [Acidimicrobiales bacterium]
MTETIDSPTVAEPIHPEMAPGEPRYPFGLPFGWFQVAWSHDIPAGTVVPRYYPKPILDYANTRGADKVMYAGYFPMGLTLERIFSE